MAKAKRAVPEGLHTVTPMLVLEKRRQGDRLVSRRPSALKKKREPLDPMGKSSTRSFVLATRSSCSTTR